MRACIFWVQFEGVTKLNEPVDGALSVVNPFYSPELHLNKAFFPLLRV